LKQNGYLYNGRPKLFIELDTIMYNRISKYRKHYTLRSRTIKVRLLKNPTNELWRHGDSLICE